MKSVIERLRRRSRTLTIYNYDGTPTERQTLAAWLASYGITVRTDDAEGTRPVGAAVLHRDGEILGATGVAELLARAEFEDAVAGDQVPPVPELLQSLSETVTVKPEQSVRDMVRTSRDVERRAWRHGTGTLHAGFQRLSQLDNSRQTCRVYRRLAETGIDVTVYGYPDTSLGDVPYTVVEDKESELEAYWFLLYDGGDPTRKAALVSEDQRQEVGSATGQADGGRTQVRDIDAKGQYDGYWTTEPDLVDTLFELAYEEHPATLRTSESTSD